VAVCWWWYARTAHPRAPRHTPLTPRPSTLALAHTPHPQPPPPPQVLDEIGVDLSAALGTAPQKRLAQQQAAQQQEATDAELDDLAARLATLRS
jgi:hypothetical protein